MKIKENLHKLIKFKWRDDDASFYVITKIDIED